MFKDQMHILLTKIEGVIRIYRVKMTHYWIQRLKFSFDELEIFPMCFNERKSHSETFEIEFIILGQKLSLL